MLVMIATTTKKIIALAVPNPSRLFVNASLYMSNATDSVDLKGPPCESQIQFKYFKGPGYRQEQADGHRWHNKWHYNMTQNLSSARAVNLSRFNQGRRDII